MELAELAACTGLSLRKIRYVVDHELVPGLRFRIANNEVGRPRHVSPDAALGIACVAALLEGGLQSAVASQLIAGIVTLRYRQSNGKLWPGHEILVTFLQRGEAGQVQLGDGVNLRLKLVISGQDFDTKWLQPGTSARLAADYSPVTLVELDLGRLCRNIRGQRDG